MMKKRFFLFFLMVLPLFFYGQNLVISSNAVKTCDKVISVSVNGGTPPYTYEWHKKNGSNWNLLTGNNKRFIRGSSITTGTYRITIKDSSTPQKTITGTYNLSNPYNLTLTEKFKSLICKDDTSSGLFVAEFDNGVPPYDWKLLDNGGNTLKSGTHADETIPIKITDLDKNQRYTLQVEDFGGCTGSHIFTIGDVSSVITPNITVVKNAQCFGYFGGSNGGSVKLDASGGWGTPFSFKLTKYDAVTKTSTTIKDWEELPSISGGIFDGLGKGTYRIYYADRLRASNFKGTYQINSTVFQKCEKFVTVTITESPALSTDITGESVRCKTATDGNIRGTVRGGTPPYSIVLQTTSGVAIGTAKTISTSGGTPIDFANLSVGLYGVQITDSYNCTMTVAAGISSPPALSVRFVSQKNIDCFGESTGNIVLEVTGGSPPYTVTITDATGTTNSKNITTDGDSFDFDNLSAGVYSINATDSNSSAITTINTTIAQPVAITTTQTGSTLGCFGDNNGTITGTISNGTPPYLISLGGTTKRVVNSGDIYTFNNLLAGTYLLTIRDSNGCTTAINSRVTQPNLIIVSTSGEMLHCVGDTDGDIIGTVSGGTAPYVVALRSATGMITRNVRNNGGRFSFDNLSVGNYRFSVTDANGCYKDFTENVINPPPFSAVQVSHLDVTCKDWNNGKITMRVIGGTKVYGSYYTFEINGVTTTPRRATTPAGGVTDDYIFENLYAGRQVINITDDCSVNHIETVILTEPPTSMVISGISDTEYELKCKGDSDGQITGTISGGTAPYTVVLDGTSRNWNVAASSDNFTIDNLKAGRHSFTIIDANGCRVQKNSNINEPHQISASINVTTLLCNGDTNGNIRGNISGGTAPYIISIDGISTNQSVSTDGGSFNFSNLKAGTYNFTIIDSNDTGVAGSGCKTTVAVIIREPAKLTLNILGDRLSCFGVNDGNITGSITGGTPPYRITMIGGTGVHQDVATDGGTFDFANLTLGNYNFTVTDSNSGSGGSGCTTSNSANINEPVKFSASLNSVSNVTCNSMSSGEIIIEAENGTPPYTFNINGTPSVPDSINGSLHHFSNFAAGNYTITTSDYCGVSYTMNVIITQPDPIVIRITGDDLECNGNNNGQIRGTLSGGTPPYKIQLIGSSIIKNVRNSGDDFVFTNLVSGNYSFSVTDNNATAGVAGCSKIISAIVTEPTTMIVNISGETLTCKGDVDGNITGTIYGGTPPYIITMVGGLGTSKLVPNEGDSFDFPNLVANTYTFTITDKNKGLGVNCETSKTVAINEPDEFKSRFVSKKEVSCFGGNDGNIVIEVTGGSLPYTFTINGNPVTPTKAGDNYTFTNLSKGYYSINIKDNCITTPHNFLKTITAPLEALKVEGVTSISYELSCNGSNNGQITGIVSGGVPPYTVKVIGTKISQSIINSGDDFNLSGLTAGVYNIEIKDKNNCVKIKSTSITEPPAINVTTLINRPLCSADSGRIEIRVTGGTAPYQIAWDDLAIGTTRTRLNAGTYIATITDAKKCIKRVSVVVSPTPNFKVDGTVNNISCFEKTDGSIDINITGGAPPLKIDWSDGSMEGRRRNNLARGSYTVSVTDANNCVKTKTFVVRKPDKIILSANVTNIKFCENSDTGGIDLDISGGTPPYQILWNNGLKTEDLVNIIAGSYTVDIKDSRGCESSKTFNVIESAPIKISSIQEEVFNCTLKQTSIKSTLSINGGTPPYDVTWNQGNVNSSNKKIMTTNLDGTYTAIVTDSEGCVQKYSFDVKMKPPMIFTSFKYESLSIKLFGKVSIVDPITFTPNQIDDRIKYIWNFGDGTTSDKSKPLHSYTTEGRYTVKLRVIYPNECEYNYNSVIEVGKGYKIITPNVFTPNQDGINDFFKPITKGIKKIEMKIRNSWGITVYKEKGENLKGWDGGSQNKSGNYSVTIKATTFYDTTITLEEFVKLLK